MEKKRPIIIAHRGASGEAPENTLSAFELALKQECDAIELDLHLSADGELIVCHDFTINRTTNGEGSIRELTLKELKKVDASYRFSEQYKGEQIPLLEEVFDLVPPHIMVNVEIKSDYDQQVQPKLLELMARKNRIDQVVVSSFNHKSLYQLKLLEPSIKVGLLYSEAVVHHWKLQESFGMPLFSLHPGHNTIDDKDIALAVAHRIEIYPYTINSEELLSKFINWNVSGIITDYPARMKALLEAAQA